MPETFLILLSGGVMLAATISDPRQVTLLWLRLCGILALAFCGLAIYFLGTRIGFSISPPFIALFAVGVFVLLQLAFAQTAKVDAQRICAGLSFAFAVVSGTMIIHAMYHNRPGSMIPFELIACAGIAAMSGLLLMDMLLGHAYLTAAKMTIAPFLRLNRAVMITIAARVVLSLASCALLRVYPFEQFWNLSLLYLITRWLVGLLVAAVFVYMAHDCIKRRSTQSATGILYVAGVLVFIGEILALNLARETGLPF